MFTGINLFIIDTIHYTNNSIVYQKWLQLDIYLRK